MVISKFLEQYLLFIKIAIKTQIQDLRNKIFFLMERGEEVLVEDKKKNFIFQK